jgi:hypothetical protein
MNIEGVSKDELVSRFIFYINVENTIPLAMKLKDYELSTSFYEHS